MISLQLIPILSLLYNPWIVPRAALGLINLYPPFLFTKIESDFAALTRQYEVISFPNGTANPPIATKVFGRYTQNHFYGDGTSEVYNYVYPWSITPDKFYQFNSTTCKNDPALGCYQHSVECPVIFNGNFFFQKTPCPETDCSSD